MRSVTSITIDASPQRIYTLAHDTLRWPQMLPHYRFVRLIERRGDEDLIEMAARRHFFPVRWKAIQRNDSLTPAIHFHHIAGWTKGMDVEWRFERTNGTTRVSIVHDVVFAFPLARRFVEERIVTKYFIEGIGRRTLSCFKRLAEAR